MYSNEDVINAVSQLTETYQEMSGRFGQFVKNDSALTELYKNEDILWEGIEAADLSKEPFSRIVPVGNAKLVVEGERNNAFSLAYSQCTATPNMSTKPVDYLVFKVKVPEGKNGAFFLKLFVADSFGSGIYSAYICDQDSTIKKALGAMCADKSVAAGSSATFAPDNRMSLTTRYWQWYAFNYKWDDVKNYIDEEGYASFGFAGSLVAGYCSGIAVAERTTDFTWLPGKIAQTAFYGGYTGIVQNTQHYGYHRFHFPRAATSADFRLPYVGEGDLLVGMLNNYIVTDYEHFPKCDLRGHQTQAVYRPSDVLKGNFARLRQQIPDWNFFRFWQIPQAEVEANTITINGCKLLQLDFVSSKAEIAALFNGFWTESI